MNTRSYFQLLCATEIDLVLSFFISVSLCTEADFKTQVLTPVLTFPHRSLVSVIRDRDTHVKHLITVLSWSLPGFHQERHSWMDFPVGPGTTFQLDIPETTNEISGLGFEWHFSQSRACIRAANSQGMTESGYNFFIWRPWPCFNPRLCEQINTFTNFSFQMKVSQLLHKASFAKEYPCFTIHTPSQTPGGKRLLFHS